MALPEVNTGPVALIFEGGGARNAYTAAVMSTLLQADINFPKAYGISAGSLLAVDYVARDAEHARAVFLDAVKLPQAGGLHSFLCGRGYMDTQYVFEGLAEMAAGTGSEWAFDWETFQSNPADIHIEAFARDTGRTIAWTRADAHTTTALMERVAASCSYPVFLPATVVDGEACVDGGMGTSHGICLNAARRDGFERFFIVRTQPRAFRMPPLSAAKKGVYRTAYARYPEVYKALVDRPAAYNRLLDEIDELEKAGSAFVFCPGEMPIDYKTTDPDRLAAAYAAGLAQSERELPQWREWLEMGAPA